MGVAQEWIIIHDAKVLRLPQGQAPDPQLLSVLDEQINSWNTYARDEEHGYEIMTRRLRYVAPKRMAQCAMQHFDRTNAVLELGTGTGLVGGRLAKAGFVVDGIDFSKEMLRQASTRGFRTLVCADLRQQDLLALFGRRYKYCISVGVYGDFIDAAWLRSAEPLLQEHATIAIAGRAERLDSLRSVLEELGFTIKEMIRAYAHLTLDLTPVDYWYVIAER